MTYIADPRFWELVSWATAHSKRQPNPNDWTRRYSHWSAVEFFEGQRR